MWCWLMMPGTPQKRSSDYKPQRHHQRRMRLLTPRLEKSPARMTNRHRAKEFTRVFSFSQDEEIPEDLNVHIVLDNVATHKTPEVHKWLVKHPRFIFHSRSHLQRSG